MSQPVGDSLRRFACLPGSRIAAFDTQEERKAVKTLARRGEWGPALNDTMMLFLERLWGDAVDASIGSFALTPWDQVGDRSSVMQCFHVI